MINKTKCNLLHDDVRMSFDKVPDINVISIALPFYQFNLFPQQVPSILEGKLRNGVYQLDHLGGFDAVHFKGVEETHKVGHFGSEETAGVHTDVHDLLVGQSVLAEFTTEPLDLPWRQDEHVGKGLEYFDSVFLRHIVVQFKQEHDIFNLFVQRLRDQLGHLQQGGHGLVLGDSVPLHDGEVLLDLLFSLGQNDGVLDHQILDHVVGEAHLLAHHFLKSEDASLVGLILILIQEQGWLHSNDVSDLLGN
jgi:hypothetical protein